MYSCGGDLIENDSIPYLGCTPPTPSPEDGRVSSEEDLEFFSNEADSIYFF